MSDTPATVPSDAAEIATSVPAAVVQNYPAWDCRFTMMPEKITVGSVWHLSCQGTTPLHPPLTLQYAADDQIYSLVLLTTKELNQTSAEFDVTSYKPGKYSPPYLVLTDGTSAIKIQGLQWEVASVIPPQAQTQQPPQPFPPYGPFILYLPWWYWATFAGLFLAILAALIAGFILRRRRRRRRELLKQLDSALTPDMELQRDLRRIPRVREPQEALQQLSRTLRVYLSRKLQVYWVDEATLKIKANLRRRKLLSQELAEILEEIDRGRDQAQKVSEADLLQMIDMVRKATEPLERKK
jgi:hypothetical protein